MGRTKLFVICLSIIAHIFLYSIQIHAATAEDYDIPDFTNGGVADTQYHDWNLGPTGARGWIWGTHFSTEFSRQILVTEVLSGTPADGRLQVNDVIVGVNGSNFTEDVRVAFGNAVSDAEKTVNQGKLNLRVWRNGATSNVTLTLKVMGSGSAKAQKIVSEGCEQIIADGIHGRRPLEGAVNALALLASGDSKYAADIRAFAHEVADNTHGIIDRSKSGLSTWYVGYLTIFLAEYKLATNDSYVNARLSELAIWLAEGQGNSGLWGHRNAVDFGHMRGYGGMTQPTVSAAIGLQLAKQAGVSHAAVNLAIERTKKYLLAHANIASLPYGAVSFEGSHDHNGRNALAAIYLDLLNEHDASHYFTKSALASHGELEGGHTGNYLSFLWAPLAAYRAGSEARSKFIEKLDWFFSFERRHDGSYLYQGGAHENPFIHNNIAGWMTTSARVLMYSPEGSLYITGKNRNAKNDLTGSALTEVMAAGDHHSYLLKASEEDAHYDAKSKTQLLSELVTWSYYKRNRVAYALSRKADINGNDFVAMLQSNDRDTILGGLAGLEKLGRDAEPFLDHVLPIIDYPDYWVRSRIGELFRGIGNHIWNTEAFKKYIKHAADDVANDPFDYHQYYASRVLFKQARSYSGILPNYINDAYQPDIIVTLKKLNRSQIGEARHNAAQGISRLTPENMKPLLGELVWSVKNLSPIDQGAGTGARLKALGVLRDEQFDEGMRLAVDYLDTIKHQLQDDGNNSPMDNIRTFGIKDYVSSILHEWENNFGSDLKPFLNELRSIRDVIRDDHYAYRESEQSEYEFTGEANRNYIVSLLNTAISDIESSTTGREVSKSVSDYEDTTAPTPTPRFSENPVRHGAGQLRMVSITVNDSPAGGVEYFFDEISGNPGATDSGWQSSPVYIDSELQTGKEYRYRIKTRDRYLNESIYSSTASATLQVLSVNVPNLVSLTESQAQSTLNQAGLLLGTVTTVHSSSVVAGKIISQSPVASSTVLEGTQVNMVISLGPQMVQVPNLVSLTQSEAQTTLSQVGLQISGTNSVYHETFVAGTTISQTPAAGSSVELGTGINLVTSLGPEPKNLIGELGLLDLSANNGINPATGKAWRIGDTYHLVFISSVSRTADEDNLSVYDQYLTGLASTAGVGGSWKVIGSSSSEDARDHTQTNPNNDGSTTPILLIDGSTVIANNYADLWNGSINDLIDLDENQVQVSGVKVHVGSSSNGTKRTRHLGGDATDNRISIGQNDRTDSKWVLVFHDSATNPLHLYAISTRLTIQSDDEPVNVSVPDVVAMTQNQASSALQSVGLNLGTVEQINSDSVAAGLVISQTPSASSSVTEGSKVNLVVSLGVAEVTVPNVVHMTQAAAETALTTAGLSLGTMNSAHSDQVAQGQVISQNPPASSRVAPGASVSLVISLGQDTVQVPNVIHMTEAQASSTLSQARLVMGNKSTANSQTVPVGAVISQSPSASSSVQPGSRVNVVISLGPPVTDDPGVLVGELGVLILEANGGLNPATGSAWKVGEKYRLVFISSQKKAAEDDDIQVYDQFLTNLAQSAGIGGSWKVLGSSAAHHAYDHTGTNPNSESDQVPVLLVDGSNIVANNYRDLWDGSLDHAINLDEKGNTLNGVSVHTGSNSNGSKRDRILGGSPGENKVSIGASDRTSGQWMLRYNSSAATPLHLYAISNVLTIQSGEVTRVNVPNLVAMTESEAMNALSNAGLSLSASNYVYSQTVAEGKVVSQSPSASSSVAQGAGVSIVISLGASPVQVPSVVGLTQSSAQARIQGAGLTLGQVSTAHSDTVVAGSIISQTPPADSSVAQASRVDLLVSLGPVIVDEPQSLVGELGILDLTANGGKNPSTNEAWKNGDTYHLVFVSSVARSVEEDNLSTYDQFLTNLAQTAGVGGTWKILGSSKSVDARDHTSTNPSQSASHSSIFLMDGSTTIAKSYSELWNGGIAHGITFDEHKNEHASVHVHTGTNSNGTKRDRHIGGNASENKVTIGRNDLTSGQWMVRYNSLASSPLQLYAISSKLSVRSGTVTTVSTPRVMGMTQTQALGTLNQVGLSLGSLIEAYSDSVPAGQVVSQTPEASVSVAQGSKVNLVISQGPANVTVPNLILSSQAQAEASILALGLKLGQVTTANHQSIEAGKIISQNPSASSSVPKGSSVNFVVSLGASDGGSSSYQPGLFFGELSGDINLNDANPKSMILSDISSKTEDRIGSVTTEVFTGQIYDADGNISFTEHIDDKTRIYIDGVEVLADDKWRTRKSTSNLRLTPGWHSIEIRISNGNGGSGPVSRPGIGFDPNGGTNWQEIKDSGDGSLLRVELSSGMSVPMVEAQSKELTPSEIVEQEVSSLVVATSEVEGSEVLDVMISKSSGMELTAQLISFTHTVNSGETKHFATGGGAEDAYVIASGMTSETEVITLADQSFSLSGTQLKGNIVMSSLPLTVDNNVPEGAVGKLMSFDGSGGGTFSVPLENLAGVDSFILYRQAADGSFKDTGIHVVVEGGSARFTLPSFSIYVLVDRNKNISTDEPNASISSGSGGGGGCLMKRVR